MLNELKLLYKRNLIEIVKNADDIDFLNYLYAIAMTYLEDKNHKITDNLKISNIDN